MNEKRPLLDCDDQQDDAAAIENGLYIYGTSEKPRARLQSRKAQPRYNAEITGATWMSHISSDTYMSALTIPGTHDSAAYTYSWPFIATQTLNITAQLNAGIRYFDLRCGLRNNILEMVHGSAILSLRLDQVLSDMYAWLEAHPSEALIAQIKRDRKEESSTLHFSQAIAQLLGTTPERWRTANTTPMLGELRGRIQLFRRFEASPQHEHEHPPFPFAYGIDVTRWQDNPPRPFTIHTTHDVQLTIQDHYAFPSPLGLPSLIARKGGDVAELLDLARDSARDGGAGGESRWFVNFTSAFEFNLYYQITPREIAAGAYWAFRWEDGMNARLRAFLAAREDDDHEKREVSGGKARYGIVAMDFPEAGARDLVMALVGTNFERKEKKRGRWEWWWWEENGVLLAAVFVGIVLLIMLGVTLFGGFRTEHWCIGPLHACSLDRAPVLAAER